MMPPSKAQMKIVRILTFDGLKTNDTTFRPPRFL
jgi:hypothetical protein